nr:hypothetical protein [Candidatus Microthrix sp.]
MVDTLPALTLNRFGVLTRKARQRALLIATFSRFCGNRKPTPRGAAAALDAVIV